MIEKVIQLIAALREGDWKVALKLTLALLNAAAEELLNQPVGPPIITCAAQLGCDLAACTPDQLAAKLQEHCEEEAKCQAGPEKGGKFIGLLLPILMELLKRFLPV